MAADMRFGCRLKDNETASNPKHNLRVEYQLQAAYDPMNGSAVADKPVFPCSMVTKMGKA